jgi:electron transport complex protein RnfB
MAALELLIGAAALAAPLGLIASTGLRYASAKQSKAADLVDRIDALLPQTQCGQCGHPGCRPYAEAIARGEPFNRCPPGRDHTVVALAELLHEQPQPLDIEGPSKPRAVAFIREAECIGCTKCIQACPVDAILGSAKLMHTVIADECTGCDLCVEPCPVDCIDLLPMPAERQQIAPAEAAHFRTRFLAHNARLERDHAEQEQRRAQRKNAKAADVFAPFAPAAQAEAAEVQVPEQTAPTKSATDKQSEIQAAIARAKAKKSATTPEPSISADAAPAPGKQAEIQAAIARAKAKKSIATSQASIAIDTASPPAKQSEIQAAIEQVNARKAAAQDADKPEPQP